MNEENKKSEFGGLKQKKLPKKKIKTQVKESVITFRLSNEETELLKQLAKREGIKPSKYLRNVIKNQERAFTLSTDEIDQFQTSFANLTRLGSNINQIAYHMNISALLNKPISNEAERSQLETLLQKVNENLIVTKEKIVSLINKHSS